MPEPAVHILGTGSALPEHELRSDTLERRLGLPEEWIDRRTGVLARRVAAEDEGCADLAERAARAALHDAKVEASELALILLATSTPDHLLPPTSFELAHRLGSTAAAFDLAGTCCGFLLALEQARTSSLAHGRPVLVVAANLLSRRIAWNDPATAALFGDGAGAVVLARGNSGRYRLTAHASRSEGGHKEAIWIPAGGARQPLDHELLEAGAHRMRFGRGTTAFRRAVELQSEVANSLLTDDTPADHFLPHQANARLVQMVVARLRAAPRQVHSHLERYGNTSGASIPILLDEDAAQFTTGETLLLAAAGSGISAAATLLEVAQ